MIANLFLGILEFVVMPPVIIISLLSSSIVDLRVSFLLISLVLYFLLHCKSPVELILIAKPSVKEVVLRVYFPVITVALSLVDI